MTTTRETTTKCEKCGWGGLARFEADHVCDREVQEAEAAAMWAVVAGDLAKRAGGR